MRRLSLDELYFEIAASDEQQFEEGLVETAKYAHENPELWMDLDGMIEQMAEAGVDGLSAEDIGAIAGLAYIGWLAVSNRVHSDVKGKMKKATDGSPDGSA